VHLRSVIKDNEFYPSSSETTYNIEKPPHFFQNHQQSIINYSREFLLSEPEPSQMRKRKTTLRSNNPPSFSPKPDPNPDYYRT